MNCQKCGTLNGESSKFCVKCGSELKKEVVQPINTVPVQNTVISPNGIANNNVVQPTNTVSIQNNQAANTTMQNNNIEQPTNTVPVQNNQVANPVMQNNPTTNNGQNVSATGSLHYFSYMIAFVLKPFQTFKEERNKLENTKISLILSGIVVCIMTILNLITSMISAVYVKHTSWFSETTYSWEWANLKNVNYIGLIFKNFLIYAIILVGIAGLFYIANLIVKKKLKFQESLSITASATLPMIFCCMVLATILGFIYAPLAFIVSIIGVIYSFLIFHELINYCLELEGNKRIYVNTICYGLIICIIYIALMITISAISKTGLTNIFGLL